MSVNGTKLPELNRIAAFFNRMPDDEPFYFLPFMELSQQDSITLYNYLYALKDSTKDFKTRQAEFNELFGELLQIYTMNVYGPERIKIGEKDNSKKVCRFCENKNSPTTFKKKAHAISEALGNKTIVLLEECDTCNEEFSKTIEPALIEYLSVFRTIYGIKGKGGEKQFAGKNFELKKVDELVLKYKADDNKDDATLPMTIRMEGNNELALQDIYKALCKYFLSVVPSEYLPVFKQTVQWIKGDVTIEKVPKIATILFNGELALQPTLTTYIRKKADKTIPYAVGELHFALFKYVFIVPATSEDNISFLEQHEYDHFWATFKHYYKIAGWGFQDFSANKKRPFGINLNITKNEK